MEHFAALDGSGCRHGFVGRVPGLEVGTDRAAALAPLGETHRRARSELGVSPRVFVTAEQVHGNSVAVIAPGAELPVAPLPGVDAIVTNRSDVCLGIYVADCCAIFLVDPRRRAIGLAHSGRQGTVESILSATVAAMGREFGSAPADIIAQLSPCIRPPWYEVDFAARIVQQGREAGLGRIVDSGVCTAANPDKYYSYRREKGRTGRMLALLALD